MKYNANVNAFMFETRLALQSLEIETFVKLSEVINYRWANGIVWDTCISE